MQSEQVRQMPVAAIFGILELLRPLHEPSVGSDLRTCQLRPRIADTRGKRVVDAQFPGSFDDIAEQIPNLLLVHRRPHAKPAALAIGGNVFVLGGGGRAGDQFAGLRIDIDLGLQINSQFR